MKYSKGGYFQISDRQMRSEMIFESSLLFEDVLLMEKGSKRTVDGWMEDNVIEVIFDFTPQLKSNFYRVVIF